MTPREFEEWYADHCRTFPGTLSWLNDLGTEFKTHQKQTWAAALASVELGDAKAATARMASGDEPAVPAYERELTGAHIRRIAAGLATDRIAAEFKRQSRAKNFAGPTGEPGKVSVGGLYRDILDVLDRGGTQDDAVRLVNERFPEVSPDRQRRYRCPRCLDLRLVYVWSDMSVQAVIDGTINSDPQKRRRACANCECSRRDREQWAGNDEKRKARIGSFYDAERHCICPDGAVDRPENIDTLIAWVTRKREDRAEDCGNYEPAFAVYNGESGGEF